MGHCMPKTCTSHNSGSAGRIALEFCPMKGANSQMKMILLIFQKQSGQKDHFDPKNEASSQLWIGPNNFLQILHNEKSQQVDESNNNGLYQKKFVQDKWTNLCPKMTHPDNSGPALRILLKFCRMKGANRYMKILLFFEKKIYQGQFDFFSFQAIFYSLIGHG